MQFHAEQLHARRQFGRDRTGEILHHILAGGLVRSNDDLRVSTAHRFQRRMVLRRFAQYERMVVTLDDQPANDVFQEKMGMGVRALPGNALRPG